ncbi:hypothetical protein CIG23_28345 [Raoultella planticola]|nr:hypothetical protein CIG23_28345 [Raoultella planticola]
MHAICSGKPFFAVSLGKCARQANKERIFSPEYAQRKCNVSWLCITKIKHTINNVVIFATNEQKIKRAGIVQNLHKTHVLIRMMV